MQPTTKSTNKHGGNRIGAGRKKEYVSQITITVPTDQLTEVDKLVTKKVKRSNHYANAMAQYLKNI